MSKKHFVSLPAHNEVNEGWTLTTPVAEAASLYLRLWEKEQGQMVSYPGLGLICIFISKCTLEDGSFPINSTSKVEEGQLKD